MQLVPFVLFHTCPSNILSQYGRPPMTRTNANISVVCRDVNCHRFILVTQLLITNTVSQSDTEFSSYESEKNTDYKLAFIYISYKIFRKLLSIWHVILPIPTRMTAHWLHSIYLCWMAVLNYHWDLGAQLCNEGWNWYTITGMSGMAIQSCVPGAVFRGWHWDGG